MTKMGKPPHNSAPIACINNSFSRSFFCMERTLLSNFSGGSLITDEFVTFKFHLPLVIIGISSNTL